MQSDGFEYSVRKSGEVEITHHGRRATVLRGSAAERFLAKAEDADDDALQHLMARITGNYKRGNERSGRDRSDS